MTQNKRFSKYVPDSYNYTSIITIVDNETGKKSASVSDFVDLLNQLNDEKEQLQQEHKNTKSVLDDFIHILNKLQANPTNEKTLNVARDMIQNMGVELMTTRFMVDDCGTLIDMETRNTYDYVSELVPLLNELYNENKQLKRNVMK